MTFEEECLEIFGTKNLYEIFHLPTENSRKIKETEIKKAYYKCSLIYHPDRAESTDGKELATKKFQHLSKAYSVLSNKDKRAVYDETGVVDDDYISDDGKDWLAYWRLLFKKVTTKDIDDFKNKYKNSDEERQDLKAAYIKCKGDMDKILSEVLCSTIDDEERFSDTLKEMIKAEEIPDFAAFTKETKKKKITRKRKADAEAKEAEKELKKLTGRTELDAASLEKMIVERNADRGKRMNSLLENLEAKYAGANKKKRSRR